MARGVPPENTVFNMKYLESKLTIVIEDISHFALFAAFLALVLMNLMMRPVQS